MILGRERIAWIRCKGPPHGVTIEVWKAFCRMAELHRLHERKIERLRKRPPKKTSCTAEDYLTEEETRWLFSFVGARADTDRRRGLKRSRAIVNELLMILLYEAGLRVSEVCCLEVENCPPIQADRSLLVTWGTKLNKQRTVVISVALNRKLKDYLGAGPKSGPALLNEAGKQFNRRSIWSKVKTIGRMAGIRADGRVAGGTKLTCHMGRHTAAMWLLDSGASIEEVAEQLGHDSVDTTRIYARSRPNRRTDAIDRLAQRFRGSAGAVDGLNAPGLRRENADSKQLDEPSNSEG